MSYEYYTNPCPHWEMVKEGLIQHDPLSDGMVTACPRSRAQKLPKLPYRSGITHTPKLATAAESPASPFLTGCAAQSDLWCTCNLHSIPLSTFFVSSALIFPLHFFG